MIQWVYEQASKAGAEQVIVATDDQRIVEVVRGFGGEVCLTRADHESGTERLAEVVEQYQLADDQIVVNVQGDEPLIPESIIRQVADNLAHSDAPMTARAYRIGAATPGVVLGLIPALIGLAVESGAVVVDASSAHRLDEDVPLVVPGINDAALADRPAGIVAVPGPVTWSLIDAAHVLHRGWELQLLVVTGHVGLT